MSLSAWSTSNYLTRTLNSQNAPLTFACWYKPSAFSAVAVLQCLAETATALQYEMRVNATAKLVVGATGDVTSGAATGNTTLVASTWYHCCGVFAAATSRKVYLNGVEDGTENTTNIGVLTPTRYGVGIRTASTFPTLPALGSVAFPCVWSVALEAAEIRRLAHPERLHPRDMRPANIVQLDRCMKLVRASDLMIGTALTATGTLTVDSDTPMVQLGRGRIGVRR